MWFISRNPHLRPLPWMLFCGSFCENSICDHFPGCFLVVHFAKTPFATTSAKAFLWSILQKLHLRPLLWMLFCGSFCEILICDHFPGCFLVVHFAKSSFATTSAKAFLWFISQKPHLRPLPRKLFEKTPFLRKRRYCVDALPSPAGQRVVGKEALRRSLAALETAIFSRGPTPGWWRQGDRCKEVTGLVPVTKHRVDRPRTHSKDQGGFLEPLGTGAPLPGHSL